MELKRLELHNFRQFYGKQEIKFAQQKPENVTVIHGSNGSGKTTILNAFTWLFYDALNLPKSDQIVSERAMAEADPGEGVEVRVTLEFEHEGLSYTAMRRRVLEKRDPTDLFGTQIEDDLRLEYVDDQGNLKQRSNPSESLKRIMPERLREIFFFDGETIDQLTALNAQDKIQEAIRNIMGLEILERSQRHLSDVQKEFEKEIEKYGSDELSELIGRKQELDSKIESTELELEETQSSKTEAKAELASVEERLGELEQSQELQRERQSLRKDFEGVEADIETINDEIAKQISNRGYLPFAMPAVETTAQMLKEKRNKGEIPSEIKTQFVDDLLEMEECICGRDLMPGSQPHDNVSNWRARAGSSELEEAAMRIVGRLTEIGEGQQQLYDEIERLLKRRSEKRDRKREIEERLSEIKTQLSETEHEDVSELENRRSDLDDQITDYERRIGKLQEEQNRLGEKINDVKEEIAEAREENEKAERARRRSQTTQYLNDRVTALFGKYQDEVRQNINDRVNDTFQQIIAKGYYAEITEDYGLKILKDVGSQESVDVAKSTGERQVASLSFISSLVSLAKDQYESDEDAIYFKGGIYPMIMDSPFGALDPTYQERVSRVLPEMGEQIIVLVTESQWSDAVAGEMAHVAGQQYHLKYNDPTTDEDIEYEYTEIVSEGGMD